MWSALVLFVATAILFLTCVFFRWPVDLEEWLHANTPAGATPTSTTKIGAESEETLRLIRGTKMQLDASDYDGAWTTIEKALATGSYADAGSTGRRSDGLAAQ